MFRAFSKRISVAAPHPETPFGPLRPGVKRYAVRRSSAGLDGDGFVHFFSGRVWGMDVSRRLRRPALVGRVSADMRGGRFRMAQGCLTGGLF